MNWGVKIPDKSVGEEAKIACQDYRAANAQSKHSVRYSYKFRIYSVQFIYAKHKDTYIYTPELAPHKVLTVNRRRICNLFSLLSPFPSLTHTTP